MTIYVPRSYVGPLKFMAKSTGIPYQVCAAQALTESGFQQYAKSSAGALGWLQFLPSTLASYGGGSPYDIWNEAYAYVRYMNHLLNMFHNSVRWALAAYNAGEGNPGAGLGYADHILRLAGEGTSIKGDTTTKVAAQYLSAPGGGGSGDDWSPHITHTARQLFGQAEACFALARAIKRM